MARARKFKTTLPRMTVIAQAPADHEGYDYLLTLEFPHGRKWGQYVSKKFEHMIPILEAMGIKIEHKPHRWNNTNDTEYYAVGVCIQHVNHRMVEAQPDRYGVRPEVEQFIIDHSNNKTFKTLLRRPVYDWDTVNYMKAPIQMEAPDDVAGFEPDYVEVEW